MPSKTNRRTILMGSLAAALAGSGAHGVEPERVRLRPLGSPRPLPARWLGFNSPAPYNVPVENPRFAPAVARFSPHYLRFPGGTVANYYQWRAGALVRKGDPDNPIYRRFAMRSRELHPDGVFVSQYVELARKAGADLVIVPNLETSTVEDQTAWFAQMNADGFVPTNVEMGNEFWLALMMNPDTLARFPDWDTTIRLTKDYVDALRPHCASDARIAVQAAGAVFHDPHGDRPSPYSSDPDIAASLSARERKWDADMRPEPWFDAVTLHLYPSIEGSAGEGALARLPDETERVFAAFLARVDEGYDRAIADAVARMPGKEIWITEWGGYEPRGLTGEAEVHFSGMWLHMIVRSLMAMLRHREVTVAMLHSLFCDGDLMSTFRIDETGAFVPINAASVMRWFCEASRGPGVELQPVAVDGTRRIAANGTIPGESFREVEACLFQRSGSRILFVQNASKTPKEVDLSALVTDGPSLTVEAIGTPDLLAPLEMAAPEPRRLEPGATVELPAYALVRVHWMT